MGLSVLRVRGNMSSENAVVGVCRLAADAEAIIGELRQQGIEPDCISVVTVEEQDGLMPVAYYSDSGRLRSTAARGSSTSLLEELPGCAVVVSPGDPPVLLAGRFAASVVRALDNAALFGDLGPLARGLYSLGIPRDAARDYELSALQGRTLVVVHGRAREVERAREIMARSGWEGQASS
jgi:hypothetical protein